jgi:hypothetical protein
MTVIAAALLMGPFATLAVAQQEQYPPPRNEGGPIEGPAMRVPEPMIDITGMLQSDGADGYVLVDQASGDSITLKKKSKKLGELEGRNVTVTGRWWKNDETTKTFKVVKVEEAPTPATAAPAEQPDDAAAPSIPEDTAIPEDAVPQEAAPEEPTTPQELAEPEAPRVPDSPEQAPSTP